VDDSTDCDDGNPDVHPGAVESCASSGVDDDCDGLIDDDDPGAVSSEWFVDLDGDGFGGVYEACSPPGTVTTDGSDCDDDDADINPDATEVCGNGVDEDCSPHSCGIVGDIEVPGAAVEIEGTTDYAYAGNVVNGVGDVDGNGVPDFAIGAQADPTEGTEAGVLYLFTTPPTGTVDLDDADATVWGGDDWDRMGSAVSGLGQFDGDAYEDLAVTAMTVGASYTGAVYLYAGPVSGDLEIADATMTFLPDATYYVTASLAGGGDTNGDGRGDVALSGAADVGQGTTFLFLGPTTASGSVYPSDAVAELDGEAAYDEALAKCFADVNADGLSDLVIASPYNETAWPDSGRVYVALGPVTGTLDLATDVVTLDGALSENAGYTVANAGDADGDGTDDLFVGAWENTEGGSQAGGAYVVLGPTTSSGSLEDAAGLITGARSDRAGQFVAGPGDVDGDGWVDFFLSADRLDSSTRGSFLVSGPVSGVVEAHEGTALFYADSGSYFGIGTHVGDLDGDGRDELLIGNQVADSGAWDGGGALLFYGAGD
jgi:hypothetical protein